MKILDNIVKYWQIITIIVFLFAGAIHIWGLPARVEKNEKDIATLKEENRSIKTSIDLILQDTGYIKVYLINKGS